MEIDSQLERISSKIQLKLKEIRTLRKENEQQKKQIELLKQQQQELTDTLENIQQQNAILKAAAGNMKDADKKEMEQTINRYLRDIDKCIAMLSE